MNTKIKVTAIAVAITGLFAAKPALADTLNFNGFSSNGAVSASMTAPVSWSGSAGGLSMTNATAGGSFVAWCVDIFHGVASTQSYTLTPGTTFYSDAGKATALSHLASNYLSLVNNPSTSGAFQLAVWEIVNEASGGTYSLTGGNFRASTTDTTATTLANSWLSNLSGPITLTANVWAQNTPGSTQDLAVFAPVPEPETYAMMLAGLGLMGFVARRRKQALNGIVA